MYVALVTSTRLVIPLTVCQLFLRGPSLYERVYYLLSALPKEWNILKLEIMILQ